MSLTTYRFGACRIDVDDAARRVRVAFAGGAEFTATPAAEVYQAPAERLGYAGDVWRCCKDRIVFHAVTCKLWGLDFSPFLWFHAHAAAGVALPADGIPTGKMQLDMEQQLVGDIQTYFNRAGKATIDVGHLAEAAGLRVVELRREFAETIREARKAAREAMR